MDTIFYKEKYSKYKSKYLESKKFIDLNGNLIGKNSLNNNNNNDFNDSNNFNNFNKLNYFTGGENDLNLIESKIKAKAKAKVNAIAYFNTTTIKGIVYFKELPNDLVEVNVNLEGFEPNTTHGFHVHESGDLTKGCDSLCAHFNPFNKSHGGREDEIRHVGDLGNITSNSFGIIKIIFTDHLIKLRGDESNIIGRGLIIHNDPDDCGKTTHELSKTTGNSGKRIACAIIGYASKCNK